MHKLYGWPCSLRKRRGATSQLSGANSLIFDNIFIHISIPNYTYVYIWWGIQSQGTTKLHAEARALFDLHHNHLGWLGTLHALNCIVSIMPVFLRCRRRLLLTLIPCCCSLQLSMVVVLVVSVVVVLHECTGCSSPRQRVGESLKQVSFQPPHRSVASCTTLYVICCANTLRPFLFCGGAVLDPSRLHLFALRRFQCNSCTLADSCVLFY